MSIQLARPCHRCNILVYALRVVIYFHILICISRDTWQTYETAFRT